MVVGHEAGLTGFVVSRAGRKHGGNSAQVGGTEQLLSGGGIVAANAVNQRYAAGHVLLRYAEQLGFFGGGGRRRFAGGAIYHQVFDATLDAEIQQPAPPGVVHRKIGGERGDQGYACAMKCRKASARIVHTGGLGVSFVEHKSSAPRLLTLPVFNLRTSAAHFNVFISLFIFWLQGLALRKRS